MTPFLAAEVAREHQASHVELDELMSRSGVVSLHAPLTPATKHLMNADRLSRMPADALLVNTACSGLVDERALVDPLVEAKIAGAAVDVAEAEHTAAGEVVFGGRALADVPNLLLTPHIRGQTSQSLLNVGATAWNDIQAVIAGRAPRFETGTHQRTPAPIKTIDGGRPA